MFSFGLVTYIAYGRSRPDNLSTLGCPQNIERRSSPFTVASSQYLRASTVVDSSKHPTYAYLLAASGVHVRVVHLVRDPRGVAYSWTRRRIEPGGGAALEMHRFSPYQSALIWDSWNLSFRFLRNCFEGYMTLKYEELVADPLGAVGSVIAFGATSSIDRAGGVSHNVGPNSHSLSGNPTRFIQTAPVVTLDDEWMKAMARTARVTVTVLTMPLLVQYDYPLRVHLPAT